MIKRRIIKVLLAFMVVAFIAIVAVQWIWIRSSLQERNDRFQSKVYEVLDQAVRFVDDMDDKRILDQIAQEILDLQREIEEEAAALDSLMMDTLTYMTPYGLRPAVPNVSERMMHNSPQIIFQFQMNSQTEEDKYISRQFIEQLGDLLGFEQWTDRTESDRKKTLDVFKKLYISIVNQSEAIDEKITILKRQPKSDLGNYLKEKMRNSDIRIPFTHEILEKKEIQARSQSQNLKGFYYKTLFPDLESAKEYYLAIVFDSEKSLDAVIYQNMDWMFIAAAFCIFGILTIFIVTIIVIMRQQKLSVIKNDFINNMTHEFKTPLATISLATSAIAKEKVLSDPNQVIKFTDIIRKENERMDKYVERILLQAKLDRMEIHLKKTAVDLNTLVDDAVQHFRLQVEDIGGELREELAVEGFVVQGDEVHLFNVFCNLIDNAIKYSGDRVDIRVSTKRENGYFVVGILDHGIGIPKEAQKKVFKRFYRVPSGNIHNVKGFGLGLSYVQSIVNLHEGTIQLTSKKNKGTLVEILFKLN